MKRLPENLRDPHALILPAESGWSDSITFKDRVRLRKIVKKVHLSFFPAHLITDYEADKLLDAFGPKVGQNLLKQAVDRGLV